MSHLTRRELLSVLGGAATFGQAGMTVARAQSAGDYKALVCIFLFGGNDAGNLIVPTDTAAYANYQRLRQNLAIPLGSLLAIKARRQTSSTSTSGHRTPPAFTMHCSYRR